MKITINLKKFPQAVKLVLLNCIVCIVILAMCFLIAWPTLYMSSSIMVFTYLGIVIAILCLIAGMIELKP